MKVTKAKVYGFCEGVKYALNYVSKIKSQEKGDIFLLGNLVHNQILMDEIKKQGINILTAGTLEERINSLDHGTIVFSAHGHDPKLDELASRRGLKVKDATCPRVIKNMKDIISALNNNYPVFYIGIKNHEESIAALSLSKDIIFIDCKNPKYPDLNLKDVHVFNQTTLSNLALKNIHEEISRKYKNVTLHNDICNATYLRQKAMEDIEDDVYYILVLGDVTSSNTKRLKEIALEKYQDKVVLLFSTLEEVKNYNFDKTKKIFLTAGASTPEEIIKPIEEYLLTL